jgi:glucuronate isomerase
MDQNFLLNTPTARELFFNIAAELPICDFHCHIPPQQIAQNKPFRSITEAWLGGDHYKWRMMRIAGVPERRITGDASDIEKFEAYASALSRAIGNPLYHWTHLELQRYFGVEEPLTGANAASIFARCNAALEDGMRPQELIARSNVRLVCTTDDPADDLRWHEELAVRNESGARVLPAFRPDKALNLAAAGFAGYVGELGKAAGVDIDSYETLKLAIAKRVDFFHEHGCRLSDHALDVVPCAVCDGATIEKVFGDAMAGKALTFEAQSQYRTDLMAFLAGLYQSRGWTMQLHIGAIRNVNADMFARLGPDIGCDAMNDLPIATPLAGLLSVIASRGPMPRIILFSLHDKDNYALSVIAGALQADGICAHVSQGPAWWYHDQRDGMVKHLRNLANVSPLSEFIGMTTDSRSLLSYTRHEYFRRILCSVIGDWVENGEFPNDADALESIVRKVCFENAMRLFE